jgi:hypothetical protein
LALIEALGHARDLLADMLDRLCAALFNGADTVLKAL